MVSDLRSRAWAEIDIDAIARNFTAIRKIVNKDAKIMGVVKADAYGHGAVEVGRALLDSGAYSLAVATLDEAIRLRNSGITTPILILGYTYPQRADEVVQYDITQTIFSYDSAKSMSDAAAKLNRNAKIHIKVDTGMTRIGFQPDRHGILEVQQISTLPRIEIEGIFTHFAAADQMDKSYTNMQFDRFMQFNRELEESGLYIPIKHVCNSAGIMECPEMHLDLVRPGIILYGLYPSDGVDKKKLHIEPALSLKARITMVKDVKEGTPVSYGGIYRTARLSRIATASIGYGDGYSRLLSNKGHVLINGEQAPIVGRICMDQCMIDVTNLAKGVAVGDEAVLIGRQGADEISAKQLADEIGTISYEVVCAIGKRVPRIYIKGKNSGGLNY
jgi:alanine racemase